MNFTKGLLLGTVLSAGIMMMYSEGLINNKRIMKKGRKIAKKMGVL